MIKVQRFLNFGIGQTIGLFVWGLMANTYHVPLNILRNVVKLALGLLILSMGPPRFS